MTTWDPIYDPMHGVGTVSPQRQSAWIPQQKCGKGLLDPLISVQKKHEWHDEINHMPPNGASEPDFRNGRWMPTFIFPGWMKSTA